jgi:hypothetical protein
MPFASMGKRVACEKVIKGSRLQNPIPKGDKPVHLRFHPFSPSLNPIFHFFGSGRVVRLRIAATSERIVSSCLPTLCSNSVSLWANTAQMRSQSVTGCQRKPGRSIFAQKQKSRRQHQADNRKPGQIYSPQFPMNLETANATGYK